MKIQITRNAVRIRLIRKLKKDGKSFQKVCGRWYKVIQNSQVIEKYYSFEEFASAYDVIKAFEEMEKDGY